MLRFGRKRGRREETKQTCTMKEHGIPFARPRVPAASAAAPPPVPGVLLQFGLEVGEAEHMHERVYVEVGRKRGD